MAIDATRPRLVALRGSTGRVGRPQTDAGRADEAELEAESLRADMLAAAARLRLVAYESLWNPERLAKRVEREAERLETQAQASGSAA